MRILADAMISVNGKDVRSYQTLIKQPAWKSFRASALSADVGQSSPCYHPPQIRPGPKTQLALAHRARSRRPSKPPASQCAEVRMFLKGPSCFLLVFCSFGGGHCLRIRISGKNGESTGTMSRLALSVQHRTS